MACSDQQTLPYGDVTTFSDQRTLPYAGVKISSDQRSPPPLPPSVVWIKVVNPVVWESYVVWVKVVNPAHDVVRYTLYVQTGSNINPGQPTHSPHLQVGLGCGLPS